MNKTNWSKILREVREEAGVTRKDLAHRSKVHGRTLADYENATDSRQLSIYKVEALLEALGYELDAFQRPR
mgnify:CR=1 FL=1